MVAALGSSQGGLTRGLTPSPSTGAAQEVPNRCLLGYDMDTGYLMDKSICYPDIFWFSFLTLCIEYFVMLVYRGEAKFSLPLKI